MIPLRGTNTGTPIPTQILQEEFHLLSSRFDYILRESEGALVFAKQRCVLKLTQLIRTPLDRAFVEARARQALQEADVSVENIQTFTKVRPICSSDLADRGSTEQADDCWQDRAAPVFDRVIKPFGEIF